MKADKSHFKDIYLFHELGGSPEGTVAKLEQVLSRGYPEVKFHRPNFPHSTPFIKAEDSFHFLEEGWSSFINPGSLLVGISLGGLLAAKLQEVHPEFNLSVFALVAPTSYGEVKLEQKMSNRVALYSTLADPIIKGRCENWPELTDQAFDVPWLMHDVDMAKYACCYLISCYMRGLDMQYEVETLFPEPKDIGDEQYT